MRYGIKVQTKASLEIDDAYFYYEGKRPGLGEEFLKHLFDYFERIRNNPEQFPQKKKSYREAFIRRFPYLIVYEIAEDKVIVWSVFNTYQDPKKKYH